MKYIASKYSRNKTVHTENCRCVQNITQHNVVTFDTLDQAEDDGFRLCRFCSKLYQAYNAERNRIHTYCWSKGYKVRLEQDYIEIESQYDVWRIAERGNVDTFLTLYHKSYLEIAQNVLQWDGFHVQAARYESVMDYLKYIREHDSYRGMKLAETELNGMIAAERRAEKALMVGASNEPLQLELYDGRLKRKKQKILNRSHKHKAWLKEHRTEILRNRAGGGWVATQNGISFEKYMYQMSRSGGYC